MSQEREVNTPSGIDKRLTHEDILKLSDEQLDAHVASVLDRGVTNSRLKVPLPDDYVGEWVPADAQSIYEKQNLGFEIDDKFALKHALHSDGTDKSIIGDVIHMIAPKRLMESIERKRRLDYDSRHGVGARKKRQIEEQGFLSQDHGGLKIDELSSAESIGINQIKAAKDASNASLSVDNT